MTLQKLFLIENFEQYYFRLECMHVWIHRLPYFYGKLTERNLWFGTYSSNPVAEAQTTLGPLLIKTIFLLQK